MWVGEILDVWLVLLVCESEASLENGTWFNAFENRQNVAPSLTDTFTCWILDIHVICCCWMGTPRTLKICPSGGWCCLMQRPNLWSWMLVADLRAVPWKQKVFQFERENNNNFGPFSFRLVYRFSEFFVLMKFENRSWGSHLARKCRIWMIFFLSTARPAWFAKRGSVFVHRMARLEA